MGSGPTKGCIHLFSSELVSPLSLPQCPDVLRPIEGNLVTITHVIQFDTTLPDSQKLIYDELIVWENCYTLLIIREGISCKVNKQVYVNGLNLCLKKYGNVPIASAYLVPDPGFFVGFRPVGETFGGICFDLKSYMSEYNVPLYPVQWGRFSQKLLSAYINSRKA